jgi:cytochrome c oxidase assembly protein subunit 15
MNKTNPSRPVAIWIYIGVGMLLVQVILGGITRLTGSGLSITEWNVVTGALPPLNEQQWLTEFDKYRQTPQFRYLNMDFTLQDFKFIFFWEWFHRFWARLIGVVFVVGFIYLVAKKHLKKEMQIPLLILFLLGALQGAVGWIMVASGLEGDAIYVKPTRLAVHFVFALGLISYAFWFALELSVPAHERVNQPALKKWVYAILAILFLQLIYGALMAGLKAATAAPTWPDINGAMLPSGMLNERPLMLNFLENKTTVHFIHRGLAYLLLILITVFAIRTGKTAFSANYFNKVRKTVLALVMVQVCLGIASVLTSTGIVPNKWGIFEWLAQLHQVVAMLLLLSLVASLFLLSKKSFRTAQ